MDPHQLNQVLSNLVQNGLRYSAQAHGRGQVWLSLARDPESDLPVLEVIDDGPGVPADKLNNLFEPFFTTESKGTGLGLYLSANSARATRHGSTTAIARKAAAASASPSPTRANSADGSRTHEPTKALIVDDEPDIRELLEITLGRMKLDTRRPQRQGSPRVAGREPFDLCLTDMRLPDGAASIWSSTSSSAIHRPRWP